MVSEEEVVAGKYRIDRVLGKGAMGEVVGAWHLKLQKPVAIKFMLPEALGNREGVERFMREARAAAQLKSQHAVKIFDVDTHPSGAPYIVMEHLEGTDLRTVQQQRGPLPVGEAATYLLQACEAIAEAHQLGIVHRDLKPANMFLASGVGGRPCVKVLDFGIAKVTDGTPPGPDSQHLTNTYAILGTPAFMSPEQIVSTRNVDARSDIWSLGVILYSFVTAQLPFNGESIHELFISIREKEPESPSALMPDIPPAFSQIILRCLEKAPSRRFQSVAELAQALEAFAPRGAALSFPDIASATTVNEKRAIPVQHAQVATQTVAARPSPGVRIEVAEQSTVQTGAPLAQTQPVARTAPQRSRGAMWMGGALGLALSVAAGVSYLRAPSEAAAGLAAAGSAVATLTATVSSQPTAAPASPSSNATVVEPPAARAEATATATATTTSVPGGKNSDVPKAPVNEPKGIKAAATSKPTATPASPPPAPTAPTQTPTSVQAAAAPTPAASTPAPTTKLWGKRDL